jgi:hypothetical protein
VNDTATFYCNCWLFGNPRSATNDKVLTRDDKQPALVLYRVKIQTTNVRGGGTDSDVFLVIHGSLGSTGEHELANSIDNFERGQKDTFEVSAVDVGSIQSISVCSSACKRIVQICFWLLWLQNK